MRQDARLQEEMGTPHFSDPFACINREAICSFAESYGFCCFFVDALGDPKPAPVRSGEAYRYDVRETITWYSGRREVIKFLYHERAMSVAFFSAGAGRGSWAGLDQRRISDLSVLAGYTIGNFVGQYHPCDRLDLFPNSRQWTDPGVLQLANSPEIMERLPVVARLMFAIATTKVVPQRTCVVGWTPDDASVVDMARRQLQADIDFYSAEEFFASFLIPS